MHIMRRIDRWVKGTVLICAALTAFAVHHNHATQPCGNQIGAAGMCAPISLDVTR